MKPGQWEDALALSDQRRIVTRRVTTAVSGSAARRGFDRTAGRRERNPYNVRADDLQNILPPL
jgi:hypothetical protein